MDKFNLNSVRNQFVLPAAAIIALILLTAVVTIYYIQYQDIIDNQVQTKQELSRLFKSEIDEDAKKFIGLIQTIEKEPALQQAWLGHDQQALYAASIDIYKVLNQSHRITHFYFHDKNGVNFLRVHLPERYGDKIDRLSLANAIETQEISYGLEIGVLGQLVLRVVKPWYINGELAGYLELGEEIYHLIDKAEGAFNVHIVALMNKNKIDRTQWEQTLEHLGRDTSWDQFQSQVIVSEFDHNHPLRESLLPDFVDVQKRQIKEINDRYFFGASLPIVDISQSQVGSFVFLNEVTKSVQAQQKFAIILLIIGTIFVIPLILLYSRHVSKIENTRSILISKLQDEIAFRTSAEDKLEHHTDLLEILNQAITVFVDKGNLREAMSDMLQTLLHLTGSEYGFIGELFIDENGAPYLKTHAISNIAWDKDTQALYEKFKQSGFEFRNLDTLFGNVMTSKQAVVSNDPKSDPRAAGLPPGHPKMDSFLGVPVTHKGEMLGMYGLANRSGGYDAQIMRFLEPFNLAYGVMINASRTAERERDQQVEIIKSRDIAEKASQAKSEFLSSMSHELKTPLNAVLGFAQLLQIESEHPLTSEQQEYVDLIVDSGKQLVTLIDNVLDLVNVSSGEINISIEAVDLNAVISQASTLIQPEADKNQISIENMIAALPKINVDADHLKLTQVILNILSNAVKYNEPQGSVKLFAEDMSDNKVRIFISDTGKGVDEASLAKMFEPFNRLDNTNLAISGTGIGLTICKQLMEVMHGEIGVYKNPDKGLTFWIELTKSA